MFSRAKRFDEKPVGCGADALYTPKETNKTVGGVIPKVDRFTDSKDISAKSDNESICSDKSIPIFRTPQSVRRVWNHQKKNVNQSSSKKELFGSIEDTRKDIAKSIDEINSCEKELKILKNEIEKERLKYESEIADLRNIIDGDNIKIENFSIEIKTLLSQSEDQKHTYEEQINQLNDDISKIHKEKMKFSVTLETTCQTVEVLSLRLRKSDEDVDKFKTRLDEALLLNKSYEAEICHLKTELVNFKKEYDNVLISIVQSKSLLDKTHQTILNENTHLVESLAIMEVEMKNNIETLKNDLFSDIEIYKKDVQKLLKKLELKAENEYRRYTEVKIQCDSAFKKITECQQLLNNAEIQIETKDQELNELSTENIKLSGTLTALEQEKRELELLLSEFIHLSKQKDKKIYENIKEIEECNENILNYEERIKKLTHFLEATEFIVKEKDNDILKLQEEICSLTSEIDSLNTMQSDRFLLFEEELDIVETENHNYKIKCEKLDKEIKEINIKYSEQKEELQELRNVLKLKDQNIDELNSITSDTKIHFATCDAEKLSKHCKILEKELEEMTDKYANLLGHQNSKQKIKHVIDLKTQNKNLKDENERLTFAIENQNTLIEKLKKELADSNKLKSPILTKKQYFHVTSSDKENVSIHLSQSPNRLGSPKINLERQLTPLKESNR